MYHRVNVRFGAPLRLARIAIGTCALANACSNNSSQHIARARASSRRTLGQPGEYILGVQAAIDVEPQSPKVKFQKGHRSVSRTPISASSHPVRYMSVDKAQRPCRILKMTISAWHKPDGQRTLPSRVCIILRAALLCALWACGRRTARTTKSTASLNLKIRCVISLVRL